MRTQKARQWIAWGALGALTLALGISACSSYEPRRKSGGSDGDGGDDTASASSGQSASSSVGASASSSGSGSSSSSGGGISGGGTGFTTPEQMFDWVNQTRQQYANHIPYDGYPFQGQNADVMTWSPTLTWDASLAAEAQAEAEKIASGVEPAGIYYPFQNEAGEGFWVEGLDTDRYLLRAMSDGDLKGGTDPFGNPKPPNKWHSTANGFYRMAVAYQTGTGAFNKKSKLGVGAAEGEPNKTWWVLVFSE